MSKISDRIPKIRQIIDRFANIADPHERAMRTKAALSQARIEMTSLGQIFAFEVSKPGVYHGKRGVAGFPLVKHEYIVVVPKDEKKLSPEQRKRLQKIGKTRGIVLGGYRQKVGRSKGHRLVSRINQKVDYKAANKARLGKDLKHIGSRGANKSLRDAMKIRKEYKNRDYPSHLPNLLGRRQNSNSFARAALKEMGHERKTSFFAPGSRKKLDLRKGG
jgi:hypothetical protein